ncbi:hypothetical protein A2480_01220 [Candidatus Uhrbacteria bacterium RIFOXYC2_FULL_47_19]|uniref:Radical SAM core domain-containing protein n=1 Tax=Candidatus Uhrbacteria bacterium RIFOXYC2_FULL_47_19 TaxID=1802424 RepID=A0A1F7WFH9_9BACT|nr:MAG: hypothetical protein A2480_01220 [Candidatus Uhrbacteria bacterium RIFOXYC2_FULL_47_19]
MKEEDWPKVVRCIAAAGARRICVGGGEPFLVSGIDRLFALIKENGLTSTTITNGTCLETSQFVRSLLSLDEIGFSVDAPSAELHARIRGAKPELLKQILAFLGRHIGSGVRLRVNTIVMPQNADLLEEIGELLVERTDEWRLLQFFPNTDELLGMKEFTLDDGEFLERAEYIRRIFAERLCVTVGSNANMKAGYVIIAPDGTVQVTGIGYVKNVGHVLSNGLSLAAVDPLFDTESHRFRQGHTPDLFSRR